MMRLLLLKIYYQSKSWCDMIRPVLHVHDGVINLLNSHIKTLESMGIDNDHDFMRGMKRAVEIIDESMPRIILKGDAE